MSDCLVFEKLFSSQSDRGNYTPSISYLNYFISYTGLKDEDLYNLEIFKSKEKFDSRQDIVLFFDSIPNPSDFDTINYFKDKLKNYNNSLANIDITIVNDEHLNGKIKKVIDIFLDSQNSEFSNDRVKQNFIIKIISWIKEYIKPLKISKDDAPKVIFYGDIKKHEAYLLLIIHLIGFDVLYLNPNEDSNINLLDSKKYKIEVIKSNLIDENVSFEERIKLGEVIEKSTIKKAMTVGAQASKRISDQLLNDCSFIKPWQLQDRKIKSLLLNSTLDEIGIYFKEPLKLRPGFTFDNKNVEVPVFFSKINGSYNDNNDYLDFIYNFRFSDDAFFIEFDGDVSRLYKKFTKDAFSLSFLINGEGIIDKKGILENKSYNISTLNANIQELILEKVEEVIAGDMFISKLNKEDRIKGLYTVLNMDKKIVHMINNFDYSLINPKLILYIEKDFIFEKEILFLMLLLSKIGFDIIVLCPCGSNCIENVINNELIDIHRLDKMVYELKLNSITNGIPLFKKIFGKRR